MTSLTLEQEYDFGEKLQNGEKILKKAGKLVARVNSALVEAVRNDGIGVEVELQFDKVMCSVNEELKNSLKQSDRSLQLVKLLEKQLTKNINMAESNNVRVLPAEMTCYFCSLLITATSLLITQIKGARNSLETSQINRPCVADCSDNLLNLENIYIEIVSNLENICMLADIRQALNEPALAHSSDPDLNALLG